MNPLVFLFRAIGIIASASLFLLGLAMTVYSFVEGVEVIKQILSFSGSEDNVIYDAMGVVDLILLSFSIFITAVGIYELFVKRIESLPEWIQVKDLDALKSILIKVIIVVMGLSFMGHVITWKGEYEIWGYGLGIGVVILALSYFLNVKTKDK